MESFFLRDEFLPLLPKCDYDVFGFGKVLYEYTHNVVLVFALKKAFINSTALETMYRSELVRYVKINYNLLRAFKEIKNGPLKN